MSKVKCELCNKEYSAKGGIVNHLKSCVNRNKPGDYLMLKISSEEDKDYFLYLLIRQGETLCTLDIFMKSIWLECCGHLSQFYTIEHRQYEEFNNVEYHGPIANILQAGESILYDYDFGSTTTLRITCIEEEVDHDSSEPIVLLARNENPYPNIDNSPRAGVCGYEEDINYRMRFLKQYQDYCKDRVDMEAYMCHEEGYVMDSDDLDLLNMDINDLDLSDMDKELLNEALMKDELESAYQEYENHIEEVLSKYRKPISEDISLEKALKRLNKDKLIEISDANNMMSYVNETKAELVNRLLEEVPVVFKRNLLLMDNNQLDMYKHLTINKRCMKDDIDIMSNNVLFCLESTLRHFLWLGTDPEDDLIYVLPKELKEILLKTDLNVLKLKAQSNGIIVKYAKALLNIYGVMEEDDLYRHLSMHLDLRLESDEIFDIVDNASCFYVDMSNLGSLYTWRETDDAEEILLERSYEPESPWKMISQEELERAGEDYYYPNTESFEAFRQLLVKHLDIPEDSIPMVLNSFFELATRFTDPEVVIAYMAEIFNLEDLSEADQDEILEKLEVLYMNCSIRAFKGFSIKEME